MRKEGVNVKGNQGCPLKRCEIHPAALRKLQKDYPCRMVSIADYSGTCREYIGWLARKTEEVEGREG